MGIAHTFLRLAKNTITMTSNRILNWQGCKNIRDLGGMKASNGSITRWGAIVRGDQPARLTSEGWDALYKHGIRTIVSLRTHGFDEKDHPIVIPPYADINVVSVEIEDVTNKEFVEKWATSDLWGTPLYFTDALTLWPHRHAAALKAIVQAQPGGVYFHCIRGYDRTGIIAFLILALAGVSMKDITADYELSADPVRDQLLAERNTNVHEVLQKTLDGIQLENYLHDGGMSQDDISALRTRLLTTEP
jgi:protein tyrosine/serine phosphatase